MPLINIRLLLSKTKLGLWLKVDVTAAHRLLLSPDFSVVFFSFLFFLFVLIVSFDAPWDLSALWWRLNHKVCQFCPLVQNRQLRRKWWIYALVHKGAIFISTWWWKFNIHFNKLKLLSKLCYSIALCSHHWTKVTSLRWRSVSRSAAQWSCDLRFWLGINAVLYSLLGSHYWLLCDLTRTWRSLLNRSASRSWLLVCWSRVSCLRRSLVVVLMLMHWSNSIYWLCWLSWFHANLAWASSTVQSFNRTVSERSQHWLALLVCNYALV